MMSWNVVEGTPIVADNVMAVVGVIGGILIDSNLGRIAAFTLGQITCKTMLVLPWMGIKRIKLAHVLVWSPAMIVQANELFDIRQLLKHGTLEPGTHLKSADRTFLGTVIDVLFDRRSGTVRQYEVSGGAFDDAESALRRIPAVANTRFEEGTNTAYLPLTYEALTRKIEAMS